MVGMQVKPFRKTRFVSGISIEIHQGDITLMHTDAIVNAANKFLKHGGGVASAILRRGGPSIQKESDDWVAKYGSIDSSHPAYTSGGNLPCKYVIHTVGPVWGEGDEDRKLGEAIASTLYLAEDLQITSICFPAISTGIFSFPVARAAGIFMHELDRYTGAFTGKFLKRILLVLYDTETLNVFISAFNAHPWKKKS